MTRREWLSLAVFSGAISLLASCGGDEEEEQSSLLAPSPRAATGFEAAKEPRQLKLAFLEHPIAVNPPKASILAREVIEGWNSGNIPGMPEGTTLERVVIPLETDKNQAINGTASVINFIANSAAGGASAADVVWLPSYADITYLFTAGQFAPLDRWLQGDNRIPLDAFSKEAQRLVRVGGQTLGLPLAIAPGVLGYNADRFEHANVAAPAPEWTWQDFIEVGKRLNEDTNDDGTPDHWGFSANWDFPDWLPLLLQEGGEVIDLGTGEIGMDGPASIRALTAWDELGKVHGIHPYGPNVSEDDLRGWTNARQSGMRFSRFMKHAWHYWPNVTPIPQGSQKTTPLSLEEALAVPAAAEEESAYEALVPLALWIGERRVLPAVTAGWQYIEKPDTDHFDLILPKSTQETALHGLANAKASYAASSSSISYHLFNQVTLPLARGEVVVEQAIDQATNWLRNYLTQ